MTCPEIDTERVLRPGNNYQDAGSGTRLDNRLSILMVPPTRESPRETFAPRGASLL